jgi:hypothetical protein
MVAERMGSHTPRISTRGKRPVIGGGPSRRSEIFAIGAVCAGLLIVWAVYELGQSRAGHNRREAQQVRIDVESELDTVRAENEQLREKVAVLETDAKIDSEGYRQVESQLATLQAKILKQQEDLAFYRGIVADQEAGVRIQDIELLRGVDDASFSMRLVLAQAIGASRRISGFVELDVEGTSDGAPVTLSLGDLAGQNERQTRLSFSFRYFQNLQADLVLPEGFAPTRVKVKLTPQGKSATPVEKSFDWVTPVG